jgi:hypothetical protein
VAPDRGVHTLIFKGINYRANVFVNGQKIANKSQAFGMYNSFELGNHKLARASSREPRTRRKISRYCLLRIGVLQILVDIQNSYSRNLQIQAKFGLVNWKRKPLIFRYIHPFCLSRHAPAWL